MNNRIYFDFYEGIHKKLSDKHDWFVRFRNDINEEFQNPYYIDGDLEDVVYNAIGNNKDTTLEIANNKWVRNPSVDIPCQYNVLVIDGVLLITHSYMDERLEDYGFKRGDNWLFRRYWNHKTQSSVAWTLHDEYLTLSVPKKERCQITYNGDVFKHHSGSGLNSNGTTVESGNKLPYNLKQNIVIPLINEMRHKQWNGRYEDIVEYLMKICDVYTTEVKEKV